MRQKLHPDAIADLIAMIVADGDVPREANPSKAAEEARKNALLRAIERRKRQVLELARQYYKINPCDFDNSNEWRENYARNGRNNLAKLSRSNLM